MEAKDLERRRTIASEMNIFIQKDINYDAALFNKDVTKETLDDFYEKTQLFVEVSLTTNYWLLRKDMAISMVTELKKYDIKTILDLGAGAGIYTEVLLNNDYNVECVEKENSVTKEFLNKYFDNKINIFDLDTFLKSDKKYDAILAIDFFEHFEDPKQIIDIVKSKTDYVIECTHFDDKDYIMHYRKDETINNYMSNDFKIIYSSRDFNIWKRME